MIWVLRTTAPSRCTCREAELTVLVLSRKGLLAEASADQGSKTLASGYFFVLARTQRSILLWPLAHNVRAPQESWNEDSRGNRRDARRRRSLDLEFFVLA